ncbi:MAG: STAS domain-containing protein [Firmicutes bacterium]|jgi:anti-sigma B factor antagonist|nr:STAS domain-containing protein [Bacillota bacterium]
MALNFVKDYNENMNYWKIELIGEVDISTSSSLKESLNDILNDRETDLKLDCKSLSYIDSTGLGVLIGILKRVKKNDNNISIVNPQTNISKLLNITGLDKIFIME